MSDAQRDELYDPNRSGGDDRLRSLIAAPSITEIDLRSMNMHYEPCEPGFAPVIESARIGTIRIDDMRDGVIWSGKFDPRVNGGTVRNTDLSDDYATVDGTPAVGDAQVSIGCMGPLAAIWVKGFTTCATDESVLGLIAVPSLEAGQMVRIGGTLGELTPLPNGHWVRPECSNCPPSNPTPPPLVCNMCVEPESNVSRQADALSPRYVEFLEKGRIQLAQGTSLHGQIVINASNTHTNDPKPAWRGRVVIGKESSTPIVLSPEATDLRYKAPYYSFESVFLGGGAVGQIPFQLYESECDPPHLVRQSTPPALSSDTNVVTPAAFSAGNSNSAVPVKLRFYGPVESNEGETITASPLTPGTTPPHQVCLPASSWSSSAGGMFLVRYPSTVADGIESRTVGLSRAELGPGSYAQIAPGLYRAYISLNATQRACEGQPKVSYWQVCTAPSPTNPTKAYYFRVDQSCPPTQCATCLADVNCSCGVTVQDVFDFLKAYFGNCPGYASQSAGDPCFRGADINLSGSVTVQDIFDFLAAWFGGC